MSELVDGERPDAAQRLHQLDPGDQDYNPDNIPGNSGPSAQLAFLRLQASAQLALRLQAVRIACLQHSLPSAQQAFSIQTFRTVCSQTSSLQPSLLSALNP